MEGGWSVKGVIRELVTSRTYRMSATFDKAAHAKDPDNALLWRARPRRLDAEALRDAMLTVSGAMDLERPRGSMVARRGDAVVGRRLGADAFNRPVNYRSVYLPFVRDALPESLALFDPADPNLVTGERESTNVPGQALFLMNNPFVMKQGEVMARRLVEEADTLEARLALAFMLCYGRVADDEEVKQAKGFLWSFTTAARKRGESGRRVEDLALSSLCQALLVSAEFRYLN